MPAVVSWGFPGGYFVSARVFDRCAFNNVLLLESLLSKETKEAAAYHEIR